MILAFHITLSSREGKRKHKALKNMINAPQTIV